MQIPAITGWHRYSPRLGAEPKGPALGQNGPSVVPPECPICEPCEPCAPAPKCPTLPAPPPAKASVFGLPPEAAWVGLAGLFLLGMAALARKRSA